MASAAKGKGKGARRAPARHLGPWTHPSTSSPAIGSRSSSTSRSFRRRRARSSRSWALGVPGFRTEALGDVERCDVVADEIRAHPPSAGPVLAALARAFGAPPLAHPTSGSTEPTTCFPSVAGMRRWRSASGACSPIGARRSAAGGSAPGRARCPLLRAPGGRREGEGQGGSCGGGSLRPGRPARFALAQAEKRLRDAEERGEARAEEVRRRAEEQREKLQGALREARARESQALEESARARDEAGEAPGDLARARAEIESLRASDAFSEAQRARGEARDLAGKVGSLESRVERLRERERELETELERARGARADPAAEPRGERARRSPARRRSARSRPGSSRSTRASSTTRSRDGTGASSGRPSSRPTCSLSTTVTPACERCPWRGCPGTTACGSPPTCGSSTGVRNGRTPWRSSPSSTGRISTGTSGRRRREANAGAYCSRR